MNRDSAFVKMAVGALNDVNAGLRKEEDKARDLQTKATMEKFFEIFGDGDLGVKVEFDGMEVTILTSDGDVRFRRHPEPESWGTSWQKEFTCPECGGLAWSWPVAHSLEGWGALIVEQGPWLAWKHDHLPKPPMPPVVDAEDYLKAAEDLFDRVRVELPRREIDTYVSLLHFLLSGLLATQIGILKNLENARRETARREKTRDNRVRR